jgi:hypothetical protein
MDVLSDTIYQVKSVNLALITVMNVHQRLHAQNAKLVTFCRLIRQNAQLSAAILAPLAMMLILINA